MNCQIAGSRAFAVSSICAALMTWNAATATVIIFDEDDFTARGTMFAQAGESESEVPLPSDRFDPSDDYSFSPDLARDNGVGRATSSIGQIFDLHASNGTEPDGFSLSGHAGGQFDSIDPNPFTGRVISGTTFDATFSLNKAGSLHINGFLSAHASEFSGSANLFAEVRLYEGGGPGIGVPLYDQVIFTPGTQIALNDMIDLKANRDYRLIVSATADAQFDGTITDEHSFEAGFDLDFSVIPAPNAFILFGAIGLFGMRRRRA